MSDTPETDAAVISSNGQWSFVLKETCRRIERERDEARHEINIIRSKLSKNGEAVGNGEHDFSIIEMVENLMQSKDYFIRKSDSLERERDEAREKLDEEMKWHHRTHTELVQTQCKILDMQMGRDEIQEKYDNLATEHMLAVNKLCEERDEAREQVNRYRYNLDLLPIKWDI